MNEQPLMMLVVSSEVGAYFFSLSSSLLQGEAYKYRRPQDHPLLLAVVQHTGPSTISSLEASTYRLLKTKVMGWGLSLRKGDLIG